MQDESSELYSTVREVREEKFPGLDAKLVEDLLSIQVQYASDPVEARKRTETTISAWATDHGEKG
jgi:hypothetical protein